MPLASAFNGPGLKGFKWMAVAGLVMALDQATKWVASAELALGERVAVLPFFSWVLWHNDGAAFSIMSGLGGWQRWFFVALAGGFSVFIVYELRRLRVGDWPQGLAYGMILGGALGNMIDRLISGYVVDFVLFHYGSWYFPAFNLADAALTCGAALWILCMIRDARASPSARAGE